MNFKYISPSQIILLASAIAIEIASEKQIDEIAILGDFLSAIGQNLSTIASQQVINELLNQKENNDVKENSKI